MTDRHIVLYHNPQSRAVNAQTLLEELGADYELIEVSLDKQETHKPEFLAINPLGKIPTIVHNGAVVTEQPAVFAYLADLYPEAGLAPAIGDPLRGPYLRWLSIYGSAFEPALMDRFLQRDPGPARRNPYGDYDSLMGALKAQLEPGPYLFGERMTAADVLWGGALLWAMMTKVLEPQPVFTRYVEGLAARPAWQRVRQRNEQLIKAAAQ